MTSYAAQAQQIVDRADAAGRRLTPSEIDEADALLLRHNIEELGSRLSDDPGDTGTASTGALSRAIQSAGFDRTERPAVKLDFRAALTPPTTVTDSAPTRMVGISETGTDRRYLFQHLQTVPIGDALRVDALVETARVLPSPLSSAVLDPTAGATKPEVSSTVVLQTFDTKMIAVLSGSIPNAIFSLPEFSTLVNSMLGHGFRAALDDYCYSAIVAASTDFGVAGDDLIEQIRHGQANVQDNGFSPNLVIVSPAQAVTLDLYRGTTEQAFILSPQAPRTNAFSPLWGMSVVIGQGVDEPIVLDTSVLTLHAGNATFAVDPYSAFATNESQARLEAPAVLTIRQPAGIYMIGTGS